MITVNQYYKSLFGEKVYKISLAGGVTCPNRDGKKGYGGCRFCSASGSGEFVPQSTLAMDEQISQAIDKVKNKGAEKFIAYFQSYTFTYLPKETIKEKLNAVYAHPKIVGVSVATRPDCLDGEILDILESFSKVKPTWCELGLQSVKPQTVEYINRCYPNSDYEKAAGELKRRSIPFVTHIILGLPGETYEDMQATLDFAVNCGTHGVKLQLLQILKDSPMYADYLEGRVKAMDEEEYYSLLARLLKTVPEDAVVYRLTGDGSKKNLIAPLWCGDKKRALNRINQILKELS